MKSFQYVITDSAGLHARPAGLLVKEAGRQQADVKVTFKDRSADGKKLFALMQLGIKCGDEVTVTVSGADEELGCKQMEQFFKEYL